MERVEVFIDGFNLYHGMRANNYTNSYRKILWLDIRKLIQNSLSKTQELKSIYYFTSFPLNNPERLERHKLYCKALEATGINIIFGKYKEKPCFCHVCGQSFKTYEEKETDVNIALWLMKRAFQDEYDRAILFSGDSDLAPAIENSREICPQKKYQVFFPLNRSSSKRLKSISDPAPLCIFEKYYKQCQLPNPFILDDGTILEKPISWQ